MPFSSHLQQQKSSPLMRPLPVLSSLLSSQQLAAAALPRYPSQQSRRDLCQRSSENQQMLVCKAQKSRAHSVETCSPSLFRPLSYGRTDRQKEYLQEGRYFIGSCQLAEARDALLDQAQHIVLVRSLKQFQHLHSTLSAPQRTTLELSRTSQDTMQMATFG